MNRATLIVFTRFPVPGRAKTRLIPALGPDGAADLHRDMTLHVLSRMQPLVKTHGFKLEVCFDGGTSADMKQWLGPVGNFFPQSSGDLGQRMLCASQEAFAKGAESVVIIGSDCPELTADTVKDALEGLRTRQVVFGPAKDGGYYLLGLTQPYCWLFEQMVWGTSDVLASSIRRCRENGIEPYLLKELSDVDEAGDLHVWEKERARERTVSVVIPALNEANCLAGTLQRVMSSHPFEVIVTDGGSQDDTVSIALAHGAKVLDCERGRSKQMNAGAAAATGQILLFLHADTLLPPKYTDAIADGLRLPYFVGGAFRFQIIEPFMGRWLVEKATQFRSHRLGIPYGDQALFVRQWAFGVLGGFPDYPIMEDYEFVRRLRRLGSLALLNEPALTSGRRWQGHGLMRTTLINQMMIAGYHCGVSPSKLASIYRGKMRKQTSGKNDIAQVDVGSRLESKSREEEITQ